MTRMPPKNKRNGGLTARKVEYTDLRKALTYRDIETMCMEAAQYGLGTVVVPSALVRRAAAYCSGEFPLVATVISYPFGTQSPCVKAREAAIAIEHGARELDVVPHFGSILAERWADVARELSAIRGAASEAALKLVLETGRLSSGQIREACAIAVDNGFKYVANTVGFRLVSTDPDAEGTASASIVVSLRELAGESLAIKAVGGISTLGEVNDLLDAGAARVGISMSPGLLRSLEWAANEEESA